MQMNSGSKKAVSSRAKSLEVALSEAHRTFDRYVDRLEESDEKAMRSVRTSVLLSGLVASAIGLGGPESVSNFGLATVIATATGVISLVTSMVVGIGTYATGDYPCGVDDVHAEVSGADELDHEEWLETLLASYDHWIGKLDAESSRSDVYLDVVHHALGLSVILLLLASSMVVLKASFGTPPPVTIAFLLVLASLLGLRKEFVLAD